jgi:hypothetical protein
MLHIRLAFLICAASLVAACGGGGGSAAPQTHPAAATSTSKPDAKLTLTIVPSTNLRKGKHTGAVRRRLPKFIDPEDGAYLTLTFCPYNPQGTSAPCITDTPIYVSETGPTTATVSVYSGYGNAYGQEFDPNYAVLASNFWTYGVSYTVDPGTTEAIAMTLSLEPAYIFASTDPALGSAQDPNQNCFNVGAGPQVYSQTFALVPADNDLNYQPVSPATNQTPPPSNPGGLSGTVTLSQISGTTDAGGTSTIVPTSETWNGYPVYNFKYTQTGDGDFYAPPVFATATTVDPNQYGGSPPFTEQIEFNNPQYCED